MEALLPVLVAVLLAEIGGRTQATGNALALAYPQHHSSLFIGLGLSTMASLSVAALGGAVLANMIPFEARTLLFGLALLFAGVPMLLVVKTPTIKSISSPIAASVFGFGRVQFGDASQFIVFAVSARSGEPILAVLGGMMGIIAATTPAIILRADWPGRLPLRPIRMLAAIVLTLAGAFAAISALRLI